MTSDSFFDDVTVETDNFIKEYELGNQNAALNIWSGLKKKLPKVLILCCGSMDEKIVKLAHMFRNSLEIACYIFLKNKNLLEFDKCYKFLESIYLNFPEPYLPQSHHIGDIYSIQLLKLLVERENSSFHLLLLKIPDAILQDPAVIFVTKLEENIMYGNYKKSIELTNHSPSIYHEFLCKELVGSIRSRVADCISRSHKEITVEKSLRLLMFNSIDELDHFIIELNLNNELISHQFKKNQENTNLSLEFVLTQNNTNNNLGFLKWERINNDTIKFIKVSQNNGEYLRNRDILDSFVGNPIKRCKSLMITFYIIRLYCSNRRSCLNNED